MRSVASTMMAGLLCCQSASAQTAPPPAVTFDAPAPAAPVPMRTVVLARDTPVQLMVWSEVSTKERGIGYRFKLRVEKPVAVDGVTVIPVGATAWGEVTRAIESGAIGKGGELAARLVGVDVGDRRVRLEGETAAKGRNAKGDVIAAVVGLGVLGLLARGNNAKIKAGEMMTGFIAEDTPIEIPVSSAL
jgi:hypothetical protein